MPIEFEPHRGHLRGVAYRMLGSLAEADDAVQEAWLRLERAPGEVANPRGWLTTVVARICLDMLRSRTARREAPLDAAPEPIVSDRRGDDRELAESISDALRVVLDKLEPAERIAFVLHDVAAMPFDEIAPIVGRSTAAARQLASRARRRIQGASAPAVDLATQRGLVEAFVAALRAGDVEGLVAVLDPEATVRMDGTPGTSSPREWARGAVAYKGAAQHMRPVLVDGRVAVGFAPHGTVARVVVFTFHGPTIVDAEIITDPEALEVLAISELP